MRLRSEIVRPQLIKHLIWFSFVLFLNNYHCRCNVARNILPFILSGDIYSQCEMCSMGVASQRASTKNEFDNYWDSPDGLIADGSC